MKKLLFSLVLIPVFTQAQIITTIAGNGTFGHSGDGGAATDAGLVWPVAVTVDHAGNVYIVDQDDRIRKVNTSGIITTIAGAGGPCTYNGDGIPATDATLCAVGGVAVDRMGNVYIADSRNNRVRKVNTAGIISTYAGNGIAGYAGDGGAAIDAEIIPYGVTVDNFGNIYIPDGNNRIRKVDTFGIITTIAGNGYGAPTSGGFSGDGGPALSAELYAPGVVALGNSNDFLGLYIADLGNNRIRFVNTAGIISTFAGGGPGGLGNGGPATAAQFIGLTGLAADHYGNVYIVDEPNSSVRVVNPSGIITTFAGNYTGGFSGDGGPATAAQLYQPYGIAVDDTGNVYIDDLTNNRIRKVTRGVTTVNSLPSLSSSINIYPNPAKKNLIISASRLINTVTISNLVGQVIYAQEYNSTNVSINVADFPNGIYFVKINGTEVRKFVKS